MSTRPERLSQVLRERLLAGDFPAGSHLGEAALAESLGASRTPVRLALAMLEQEGLVVRAPNRGYRVRGFTVEEIEAAVKMRGELEAIAARMVAERGLGRQAARSLEATILAADNILAAPSFSIEQRVAWLETNVAFHGAIVREAGNPALEGCYAQICSTPLASPRGIVFAMSMVDSGRRQILRAQEDHVHILSALERGEGARAEALMREHGYRSAENKRANLEAQEREQMQKVPGLALVDLPRRTA